MCCYASLNTLVMNLFMWRYCLFITKGIDLQCRIAGKFCGGKVWRIDFLSIWRKKVQRINRSANRLLIVSTNLVGFSLVNHGWFAKFTKLSRYTVVQLIYVAIGSQMVKHQLLIAVIDHYFLIKLKIFNCACGNRM